MTGAAHFSLQDFSRHGAAAVCTALFTLSGLAMGLAIGLAAGLPRPAVAGPAHAKEIEARMEARADIAAQLAPHKAIYDIAMISNRTSGQIVYIKGRMFYEWQPACDAWLTRHRFSLKYDYADSPPMQVESDFSAYETIDGTALDFHSSRARDGDIFKKIAGSAALSPATGGKAAFLSPAGLEFDLDAGTLFPVAHTAGILAQAKAGQRFFRATVFDGSDEDGPMEVSAFIGPPLPASAVALSPSVPLGPASADPAPSDAAKPASSQPAAKSPAQAASGRDGAIDRDLLADRAWPVRLAFFPLNGEMEDADYEMDITLHENGVISDMTVDYRTFTVSQKLAGLEKLKPVPCDKLQ